MKHIADDEAAEDKMRNSMTADNSKSGRQINNHNNSVSKFYRTVSDVSIMKKNA